MVFSEIVSTGFSSGNATTLYGLLYILFIVLVIICFGFCFRFIVKKSRLIFHAFSCLLFAHLLLFWQLLKLENIMTDQVNGIGQINTKWMFFSLFIQLVLLISEYPKKEAQKPNL
jgi:hypothetical protein